MAKHTYEIKEEELQANEFKYKGVVYITQEPRDFGVRGQRKLNLVAKRLQEVLNVPEDLDEATEEEEALADARIDLALREARKFVQLIVPEMPIEIIERMSDDDLMETIVFFTKTLDRSKNQKDSVKAETVEVVEGEATEALPEPAKQLSQPQDSKK